MLYIIFMYFSSQMNFHTTLKGYIKLAQLPQSKNHAVREYRHKTWPYRRDEYIVSASVHVSR